MTWVFVAFVAYIINAVNSVIDKLLLDKNIPNPIAYTFYVGLFSIFALAFAPFSLVWPGLGQLFLSFLVGLVFLCALLAFFIALSKDEVSRIAPIVGAFIPIFVFLLSFLFLGERLFWHQVIAFFLLFAGGILILARRKEHHLHNDSAFKKYTWKKIEISILAALLFAIFYVLTKFVFSNQPFVSTFVWTRVGSFLAAFLLIIPKGFRRAIFHTTKNVGAKGGSLFIFNKLLAGIGFLLLNYAISLGSVTLVNALQGIQYVAILIIAGAVVRVSPGAIKEEVHHWKCFLQKVVAVFLIGIGLMVLAF